MLLRRNILGQVYLVRAAQIFWAKHIHLVEHGFWLQLEHTANVQDALTLRTAIMNGQEVFANLKRLDIRPRHICYFSEQALVQKTL